MATKKNPNDKAEEIEVKSAPKVNDVAKPGSTAAPPTSRPIITNHGGMIKKDPMVSGKDDITDGKEVVKEEEKNLAQKSEVNIAPISESEKTEPTEEAKEEPPQTPPDTSSKDETAAEKPAETPAEDEAQEKDKDKAEEKPTEDTDGSDAAAIDSLAGSAEGKKMSAHEADAQKARAKKVQQMVASRQYNVPITEGGRKGTGERIVTWLFIFLLLCSTVAYLAADAGYLDIGIDLPYDFIKNNP